MLAQILLIVGRILVAIGATNTVLSFIQNVVSNLTLNPSKGTLDQRLNRQDDALLALGSGETAIITREDIIIANQSSALTAILAAIADAQQASNPVILPTTPPTGYGGGSGGSTAADIWNYQYPPGSGNIVGDKLVKAGRGIEFLAQDAWFPSAYCQYVGHHFDYSNFYVDPSTYPVPLIDPTTILSSDASIVAWLNRTVSGFTWTTLNGQAISYSHTVISDEWWVCTITKGEFDAYKGSPAASGLFFAPVWPGEENATFGERITLEDQQHVEVDCHGLYIHITGVPTGCNFYQFGPVKSYRNIGAVQFISDDGNEEMAQVLAMEYGQYCPKAMVKAHGFLIRAKGGVTGTIDPWTITPA